MAGLKEVKRRLRSVQNTSKITYAMKLVSAAKLKKVQDAVTSSRAYTAELSRLVRKVSTQLSSQSIEHPLLEVRPVKRVAVVVIGGQRGLCGGYNSNVNKAIETEIREITVSHPGASILYYVLGKKPSEYFRKVGRSYERSWEELPENVAQWPIEDLCVALEEGYANRDFDQVRLIYTQFKSAITVKPVSDTVFPLGADIISNAAANSDSAGSSAPVKFEPSVVQVVNALLPRIARTKFRQAALDAKASETASRMTAMDSATRNAKQLSRKLQLFHNRIRQQVITSQLLDIIGGAEAV